MTQNEETGSPGWRVSFFLPTTEDVARAVAAAAAAASTVRSSRPSVVYSSKDDNSGGKLQKLQYQVSRVLKGFSSPPEKRSLTYNPEVLTSQKRQWANFQLQSLDQRCFKEPSRLFESMVVVGLHPKCDIQALRRQFFARKSEGSGKFRNALSGQHHSRVEPNLEPQVLFAYPPEKQLPLQYKDLLSFCFPGGVEVHAVERTPSMSELNEILLGQEHLKQNDLSFVFRLQAADNSALYGCCVLVEELVQKPSRLISMISNNQSFRSSIGRHILTTRRCYCILSRLPFFELHFGVLNGVFMDEKLEWLTRSIDMLDLEALNEDGEILAVEDNAADALPKSVPDNELNEALQTSSCSSESTSDRVADEGTFTVHSVPSFKGDVNDSPSSIDSVRDVLVSDNFGSSLQSVEKCMPEAVWPLFRYRHYESSESSSSFQSSPCEDRHLRSENDEADTEEASFSGQDDFTDNNDILEWAKKNHNGPLQIICEYYRLGVPSRGSTLTFHPLEHLHPLKFHRPDERVLNIAGSSIDLRSCSTSLEMTEVQNSLLVEEEASALSVWAISCICGSLRLDNVLTFLAGALLEKQIVVVCSNLGMLSASVLSIIPLIRPYQWQSLLMPVLPNDMLDFLDAPVPYIVGVQSKTSEVQSKLANVVLVDINKNQVRSPSVPQLPKQKELMSSLSPYHSKLVGESYLARRRPVYECTDVQVEATRGFLGVLRDYLDSFCSNLRSHTITNVQSNDDKVSLLLKESFIDSFPSRHRPFMKLFVDTQLFSVHTDLVLSFYQKD